LTIHSSQTDRHIATLDHTFAVADQQSRLVPILGVSKRAGATSAGNAETSVKPQDDAQKKQAQLLAQDNSHFSLVKQVTIETQENAVG
jgi:hypothetical protein